MRLFNRLFLLLALAIVVIFSSCASPVKLSESQQYYLGRSVTAKTLSKYTLYNQKDPELASYVTDIGYAIALESDRPELFKGYNFIIVEDDNFNACSFPSGFILITTGAIKHIITQGQGEDELAAIIAHEIAHINLHHPEKVAQKMVEKQEAAKLLATGIALGWEIFKEARPEKAEKMSDKDLKKLTDTVGKVVDVFGDVVVNGYGREQELAADKLALDLLGRAGYNPSALRNVLSKLPKTKHGTDIKGWLAPTHPQSRERISIVDDEIRAKGYPVRDSSVRKARFQQKTSRLSKIG
jgi:predicted Zn-dependent protease